MGPDSVCNLAVWRESLEIVKAVYRVSGGWPRDQLYGLTSQVRSAAVSVPANLAEGVGRGSAKETARFASIALGSVYELDTLLHIAQELGYAEPETASSLRTRLSLVAKQLSSFIRYQRSRL